MTYQSKYAYLANLILIGLWIYSISPADLAAGDQWQDPFQSVVRQSDSSLDSLTLVEVLGLVAEANPGLKTGLKRIEAANGLLTQAGLWSNPELELEMEEVGWDAPGFKESEFTVLLSQEIEVWGNRKNRKQVARRDLEVVQLETQIAAFDIYTATVERFSTLDHAQRRLRLTQDAVNLASDIATAARIRVDMGAAMQSELLMGQLETVTAELQVAEATSELEIARTELVALWQGEASAVFVTETDFDPTVTVRIDALQVLLEGSRGVRSLEAEAALAEAELNLERSGAKPNLSLSGGFKRLAADGSSSFVLGVGFPLPFLNRNQGNIVSLEARKDAIRLSRQQALLTARANFETSKRRIEQQVSRYWMISAQVLPKAEETYLSLKSAYKKGKLPYFTLLDAQRIFLDLRFELNDIGLTIKHEIVALERLLGVTIP